MQIKDQSLVLGHFKGAPIRFHWSILLGMFYFGGLEFAPGFWLGFCFLILCHELGHGLLVAMYGLKINDIVVHGFGGHCEWLGHTGKTQRSVIAWGGVLAQALLFLAISVYLWTAGAPSSPLWRDFAHVMTSTNLLLIAINLIPIPPLDGAQAWLLFPRLFSGKSSRMR